MNTKPETKTPYYIRPANMLNTFAPFDHISSSTILSTLIFQTGITMVITNSAAAARKSNLGPASLTNTV